MSWLKCDSSLPHLWPACARNKEQKTDCKSARFDGLNYPDSQSLQQLEDNVWASISLRERLMVGKMTSIKFFEIRMMSHFYCSQKRIEIFVSHVLF